MQTQPCRDRDWIASHIPHGGSMCLLDGVIDWTAESVRCLCIAHRSPQNPLRALGRLSAICGIEIAAQAVAVHGALIAPPTDAARSVGYLAGVRNVTVFAERLDDIAENLIVAADRLGGDAATVLYDFKLTAGARVLLKGRMTIIIDPAAASAALQGLDK